MISGGKNFILVPSVQDEPLLQNLLFLEESPSKPFPLQGGEPGIKI